MGRLRCVQAVREQGAVVEAVPSQPLGAPSVCLLVQPTGAVSVVATFERIFCPAHVCVGHACPQMSVTPAALADAAVAIGEALARDDFMGAPAPPDRVAPALHLHAGHPCVCMHACCVFLHAWLPSVFACGVHFCHSVLVSAAGAGVAVVIVLRAAC